MAIKKSSVVVNDVLEELSEENNRLLNELLFANKCLKVLSQFKTFIDFHSKQFKSVLNENNFKEFEELNQKLNEIVIKINNKFNEEIVTKSEIKDETKYDYILTDN